MAQARAMAEEAWAKYEEEDSTRPDPPLPCAPAPPSSPAGRHARAVASHSSDALTHAENRRAREEELRRLGLEELRSQALESGVRRAKVDSVLEGHGGGAMHAWRHSSDLMAEQHKEALIALIVDHEEFERIINADAPSDETWRKITKMIGGEEHAYYKKHNQLSADPGNAAVLGMPIQSHLSDEEFKDQLALARRFDVVRANRRKRIEEVAATSTGEQLAGDANVKASVHSKWHMRRRRVSVEAAMEVDVDDLDDGALDGLADSFELDEQLNMSSQELEELSIDSLEAAIRSLVQRMKEQADDARDDRSREYLNSVATNLTSVVEQDSQQDLASRKKALIMEIKMHQETDHAKLYDQHLDGQQTAWVAQQMRAIGAQPAPPGMERSKKNPRQLQVKKLDAERVVEALLSGEQTSETVSRRMQVTGFGGAALGSHQERKNRSRNLTTWCRLGAMAAVVDSSRPVHEDGAIRRIGRIVRFIERKEDLDHVNKDQSRRYYTYRKWLNGTKESKLVGRWTKESGERYVLEKVAGEDDQPLLDKTGQCIYQWKRTDGSPCEVLSGNTWLSHDATDLEVQDAVNLYSEVKHIAGKFPSPAATFLKDRLQKALEASDAGSVDVDYRCVVVADSEDIECACSNQVENTKRSLVNLIIMCHWKLNLLTRLQEREVWEMYKRVNKIDEDKRRQTRQTSDLQQRADVVRWSWRNHAALHQEAATQGLDVLPQTQQTELEAKLFALTQEALKDRARSVRGWAPGELRQEDKHLKLYARKSENAWVCPWEIGAIKDGAKVQIRLQASVAQPNLSAQWCDSAWWRNAPWRDDEWWEQDNAPRSEAGALCWHPGGYPQEKALPATVWDEDGAHHVAFAGTLRALPPTRQNLRTGVLVELEYSTLEHDYVDIRDLYDAERLHDGYTLSELNQIAKPFFWCKTGAFATYVLNDNANTSNIKTPNRTGEVVHVDFKEGPSGKGGVDLGSDGRADRQDDMVTIDFGLDAHGNRDMRKVKVSFLRVATKNEEDQYKKTQQQVRKSAETLEFAEAQVAKKDFYNYSLLERKKKGQRWKDNENPALKGLAMSHPLRLLTHDEDEESFLERQKVQARTLARLLQANTKLTARVLDYVRTLGPNADSTQRAVRNLLINSPNPLWTCYELAAHLDEQAYYPVIKSNAENTVSLDVIFSNVKDAQDSTSEEGEEDGTAIIEDDDHHEQNWSREAATKMVRLATAIATELGIDEDDANLCAAFLQPKLTYDPLHIKPPDVDDDDLVGVLTQLQSRLHGLDVEPSGSTDAGPLYEAICAGDTEFVSVPWVKEYVEKLNAGSFELEDEYVVDLPTGLIDGFYGTKTIESARKRMYTWLVQSKVWPRWYFVGVFYCWCGLQVPGSLFRVPNFRYGLDIAMYLIFLWAYTSGVVLDRWNVSHLSVVQLSDSDEYDGPFYVCGMRVYSMLYLLGALERELRQLARLGPITYFSDFWNIVEMTSPAVGAAGLVLLETGGNIVGVSVLAFAGCLLWLRLLQPLRASHSIGPLIPVMIRMLREVGKFAIVLLIVVMGFAVGMHSILQESANHPEDYEKAKQFAKAWPSDYADLTTTVNTLARAALGDFSADFTYSDYEKDALFGLTAYILLMMLMLMNLLITLLMKRYDEVEEKMDKQFAFVRAASVFWLQDSVLDNELPPPFNLLQLFHPNREKVAWLVWLAIVPPTCAALLLCSAVVVGGLYVPYFAYMSTRRQLEGDTDKIPDTNINAPVNEDVEFLMSLEDHSGFGVRDRAQQIANAVSPRVIIRDLLWTAVKPLLMVACIAFGVGHWALIFVCTLLYMAVAYLHAIISLVQYSLQLCSAQMENKYDRAKEQEARQNIQRLCENYAACIDFLAEKDWDKSDSRGKSWTNNSETGILDRLLANEFKSEEELEMEESKKAKQLACEGVELARRRKIHAGFIQRLWTRAKETTELEKRKEQEQRQLLMDAESATGRNKREEIKTIELKAEKTRKQLQDSEEALKTAFELFDKDGNGFISSDELSTVLKSLTSDEGHDSIVRAMMAEADTSGDGQIQYSEFVKAIVQGSMSVGHRDETEQFLEGCRRP